MNRIFIALLLIAATLASNIVPYHPVIEGKSTREYVLEFQYACRAGLGFDSCQGNIYWNNKIIMAVSPNDYEAHTKIIHVFVDVGENIIKFEGAGKADGRGMILDNVKLTRLGDKKNIVRNGDFEKPDVQGKWKIVMKPTPRPHPQPTMLIRPAVLLNKYTLTFDHACRKNVGFDSCQGKVFWNGKEVAFVIPTDYLIHGEKISLEGIVGENTLRFEGAGKSDSFGLTFDNVKLVK